MIASRNMSKHRQQAEQVGINRFIAKSFSDGEVLEVIHEMLELVQTGQHHQAPENVSCRRDSSF